MEPDSLPALTTDQMIQVDRLMIHEYGISLTQMMENAGRNLASLTRRLLGGDVESHRILVLAGAGNNGGGGLVAARHLSNWGGQVDVLLAKHPRDFKEAPSHQFAILQKLPVNLHLFGQGKPPNPASYDYLLDALIGYGLEGNPRGAAADIISLANSTVRPILSLDAPSGLNTTEGYPGDPCIKATATMTLALPKLGLKTRQAAEVVGDLYLADISVPPSLYEQLNLTIPPIFATSSIILIPGNRQMSESALAYTDSDRFSAEVQNVLDLAKKEAKQARSKYVSTGHLLLGLLTEDEGIAGLILHELALDERATRSMVNERMQRYKGSSLPRFGKPSLSERVERVLGRAVVKANLQGQPEISTGHVLLALLDFDSGLAGRVLKKMGLSPSRIRSALQQEEAERL